MIKLLYLFVLVCAVSGCEQPAGDLSGSMADEAIAAEASPESESSELLVDARWLMDNLEEPSLRLFDLGKSHSEYLSAHIPNAIFLDWRKDITDSSDPGKYTLLAKKDLERLLRKHGVEQNSIIVLSDNLTSRLSARMFWTLRYYGHRDIRILDGGEQAWLSTGFPLVEELPQHATSNYQVLEINTELLATRDYIEEGLGRDDIVLVDGRPFAQYTGDTPGKVFHTGVEHSRKGHIYGAKNVVWKDNFRPDGTFKSAKALRALYLERHVPADSSVVTYCNEGLHAAPPWFVLHELLGYEDVRLYDNSLAEWANDFDTPMKTGEHCM